MFSIRSSGSPRILGEPNSKASHYDDWIERDMQDGHVQRLLLQDSLESHGCDSIYAAEQGNQDFTI